VQLCYFLFLLGNSMDHSFCGAFTQHNTYPKSGTFRKGRKRWSQFNYLYNLLFEVCHTQSCAFRTPVLKLSSWYADVDDSVGYDELKRTVRDHLATITPRSIICVFPNDFFYFVVNSRLQPYHTWVGADPLSTVFSAVSVWLFGSSTFRQMLNNMRVPTERSIKNVRENVCRSNDSSQSTCRYVTGFPNLWVAIYHKYPYPVSKPAVQILLNFPDHLRTSWRLWVSPNTTWWSHLNSRLA